MADTAPQVKLFTEDELLRLDSQDGKFEVIDGELVPMAPVGFEHSTIMFTVAKILDAHAIDHKLGYVHPDNMMHIIRSHEEGVVDSRSPDVSFIRKGRLPKGFDWTRPFPGAPDLAVEVISPSENATEILKKVQDYLSVGTEEVWVIYPKLRTLHRYLSDDLGTVRVYHENDTFEPESLFPGLKISIAACFKRHNFEEE